MSLLPENPQAYPFYLRLAAVVAPVTGTIVECGVGEGDSLLSFAKMMRTVRQERDFWAYDAWDLGFPEPTPEDYTGGSPPSIAPVYGTYTPGRVRKRWKKESLPPERLHLVRGLFCDTLGSYDAGPIALLHLDCDLYASYRAALMTLWPQIAPHGIVICDEVPSRKFPGARLALRDFLCSLDRGSFQLYADYRWWFQKEGVPCLTS